MKVLKPGRKQKGWATETKCTGTGNGGGGCGAELLVDESDLFQTSHTDMGGDTEYFVTFRCSECGVMTDLPKVPHDVRQRLPSKAAWYEAHYDPRD